MLFRIYIENPPQTLILGGEQFNYLHKVLRLQVNNQFEIISGLPEIKTYQINKIAKDSLEAVFEKAYLQNNEPELKITIAQAMPKGEKLEYILQKCTELGAHRFILFESSKSPVKLTKLDNKLGRWDKIVESAVCQSRRNHKPTINTYNSLQGFLEKNKLPVFFAEPGSSKELQALQTTGEIVFVIGPESGFAESELLLLKKYGEAVSLGKRILRTETAAIAVCAKLLL